MMRYQTLLFDVDDTLFDFQAAEKQAVIHLFQDLNLPLSSETYAYYHQLNESLWRQYEVGQITRPALLVKRFHDLFAHMGHSEVDDSRAERLYRDHLAEGHELEPDALQLITDLKPNYELYVVTNGVATTQRKRLADAHVNGYFENVFISEVLGAQKPEPEFFELVADQIPNFDKAKTLVIGDSLTSDIKGANGFDLDSVWFNPNGVKNQTDTQPTYEISKLLELERIV